MVKLNNGDYSMLKSDLVRTAIKIANPSLEKFFDDNSAFDKKKFRITTAKYLIRMCTNPIPFGLFAGGSIIQFKDTFDLNKKTHNNSIINCRLNFSAFYWLYEEVLKRKNLRVISSFYINPTIHYFKYNNTVRFLNPKFNYANKDIEFQYIEVECNEYIDSILSNFQFTNYSNILNHLILNDVDAESAERYLNSLIDIGFLVNDLFPSANDPEYFDTFIKKIELLSMSIENDSFYNELFLLSVEMKKLYKCNFNVFQKTHYRVEDSLKNLGFIGDDIFHVDLQDVLDSNSIDKLIFKELPTAVKKYIGLLSQSKNHPLQIFKKNFRKRYGESKVPLKLFYDRDVSINLFFEGTTYNQQKDDLFSEVYLHTNNSSSEGRYNLPNYAAHIHSCIKNDQSLDLSKLESTEIQGNIFSVSAKFAASRSDVLSPILIKDTLATGFSSVLGRFNYLNGDFTNLHKDLELLEDSNAEELNTEIVDIFHFPNIKASNLVVRKSHRNRYIAICSNGLPNKRISIDSLYLQLENDKLVLRTFDSDIKIIPKLSNAHNYLKKDSCQLYSLLALIGTQDLPNYVDDFSSIINLFGCFPRVHYKNFVFVPKSWLLHSEIRSLSSNEMIQYFKTNKLPKIFNLLDDKGESIVIDLDYSISIEIFINIIRNCKRIIIQEHLFYNENNNSELCEIFFSFTKK